MAMRVNFGRCAAMLCIVASGWWTSGVYAQPTGPFLDVDPAFGPAGVPVQLVGGGFRAGTCAARIYLDTPSGTLIATAAVGSNGFFTTNGVIPIDTTTGAHTLVALGFEAGSAGCSQPTGETAQAAFRVIEVPTDQPLIQISDFESTPGNKLIVTGTGFCPTPPCSGVDILFMGKPGALNVPVGADGVFLAEVMVPGGIPVGLVPIGAYQTAGDGSVHDAYGEIHISVRPNMAPIPRVDGAAALAPVRRETPRIPPGEFVIGLPTGGDRSLPPSAVTDVNPEPNAAEPRFGGRSLGITIDPTNINTAYVASELGGIWRSVDAGVSWSHVDDIPLTIARDTMYDPQDASILLASGRYDATFANNGGIWRSTDGGATWAKPATSNPGCNSEASAWGISIPNDAVEHDNIFVGTDCGVAISDDSGATWTHVDPCTAADAGFCGAGGIIYDVEARVVGGNIQVDVCGDEGFFRSTDGGVTWSAPDPASPLLSPAFNPCHIATAPQDPNTVYLANYSGTTPSGFCQMQLLESTAGGAAGSWVDMGIGAQNCREPWVVTHPALNGDADLFEVYVGDAQRMRGQTCDSTATPRCQPAVANWPQRDAGAHADPSDIAFDPSAPNGCPVLASNDGGLARSTDCGANWVDANVGLHALDIVGGMAGTVNPAATDLYIATQDNGIYVSQDNASTWSRPVGADGYNVAADHNPPARVYYRQCFGCSDNIADPGIVGAGPFTDPPGNVPTFAIITQFGPLSYAMITNDGGSPALWTVYVTTDEGGTWSQMGPATLPGNPGEIRSAGPAGSPTFFLRLNVGGNLRIYRLSGAFDNTATLTWISSGLSSPNSGWNVDPENPNFLYATDLGTDQMMFTTDGGGQWDPDPELTNLVTQNGIYDFDTQTYRGLVSSVKFDPNSETITVGTRTAGVVVSVDGGANWVFVPGSMQLPLLRDYFFDESDGSIYAATRGRGIWRIGLPFADLSIEKSDSPDPVAGGAANGVLTYTVRVTNAGPDIAHEVVVTDTLPPGTVHTGDTAACVPGPGPLLTCNLGDLDPDAAAEFDITVEVSSCEDIITNSVTVVSLDPDPNPDDNTAIETTQVIDVTPPEVVACGAVGGFVDENCEFTVTFTATVTDDCCVTTGGVAVIVDLPTGNATLGVPVINSVQTTEARVDISGSVVVSALTSCPATVRVTVNATDCSDNADATPCVDTADVNDNIPPTVVCPAPLFLGRGPSVVCPMTPQEWLDSFTATDNCDASPTLSNNAIEQSAACCIFPCDGETVVTFTAEDDCMNTNACESTITSDPNHPGWNASDIGLELTANQPTYWSLNTGEPATGGVSAFDILDPGCLRGRVDPECGGFRTMRGFIVAYAVNDQGQEIRWNHLKGDVTVVNYADSLAWEYAAYAFRVTDASGVAHGQPTLGGGQLALNGLQYAAGPDLLLLDFYADGATHFGAPLFSELTLMPLDIDLRQETGGPVTTKASFTVWNMNETKFTGLDRCVTCWDQLLFANYNTPNHLLRDNLQTDKGKAQIDGLASQLCDVNFDAGDGLPLGTDPRDVTSQAAALIGVSTKYLYFPSTQLEAAASELAVMGIQAGLIQVDVSGGLPPERPTTGGKPSLSSTARPVAEAIIPTDGATTGGATTSAPVVTGLALERLSVNEKGSLLIFPVVEVRWDSEGNLLQDSFIDIANDFTDDVRLHLYYVNGDPPLP